MDSGTFLEFVASGDRRKALQALRDYLAVELVQVGAAVAIAPIAGQLRDTLRELDQIQEPEGAGKVVDLRARIAGKQAATG